MSNQNWVNFETNVDLPYSLINIWLICNKSHTDTHLFYELILTQRKDVHNGARHACWEMSISLSALKSRICSLAVCSL